MRSSMWIDNRHHERFDESDARHHFVSVYLVVITLQSKSHRHRQRNVNYYRLYPNEEVKFMSAVSIGHTVVDSIVYLDQNGNPMLVTPVPDSPPVWTNIAAATVDTMTVSADGSTDTINALAAGVDTITVNVIVGGKTFTATQQLSIAAAPQVLTAVAIDGVVN
jgi:hypothetical protein